MEGKFDQGRTVSGKKFVIWLFAGFVAISIICSFGTWWLGSAMRPLFKEREAAERDAIAEMREREIAREKRTSKEPSDVR